MLRKTIGLLLLALSSPVFAQAGAGHPAPRLVSADLPDYPPIAYAARVAGSVRVRVEITAGKVTRAEVASKDGQYPMMLANASLENVRTWHFAPSVNDSFVVTYTYVLAGVPDDAWRNPKIEISPSLDVTVTARPPVVEEER
ncbi:MAG: TonB family protein [Acidobacteriaceae bacterium]